MTRKTPAMIPTAKNQCIIGNRGNLFRKYLQIKFRYRDHETRVENEGRDDWQLSGFSHPRTPFSPIGVILSAVSTKGKRTSCRFKVSAGHQNEAKLDDGGRLWAQW